MKPCSIAIALAFCASLVSTPYAQSIPPSRLHRLEALGKQLHVTRKQAEQLMPILAAEEPKLQAIRNDPSLSRMERLRQLQAVHEASDPQVKAILTPVQYKQLQVIRQKRRAQLMAQATKVG